MDYQRILHEIEIEVAPSLGQGAVADYIPILSEANAEDFAMSVVTVAGDRFHVGRAATPFSIQSISKVFTLLVALERDGDALWERVGREPSGTSFNSIVQLERENGVPRNPFINAGALVVTDALISRCADEDPRDFLLAMMRRLSQSARVRIDAKVAESEKIWGDRNRSLAYFMKSFGVLENRPEDILDTYFCQCALEMTTGELARAGLFLANDGVDPLTSEKVAAHDAVNRINALMLTCGHYDRSGDFAFRVGLPGKSGVGGGILAVAPGVCAVAAWSPGLNEAGNSLSGSLALELFSAKTGLNLF